MLATSNAEDTIHPPQSSVVDYDVVIVGAGVAGCSAAYHLLQEKNDIRLLVVDAGTSPGEGLVPDCLSGSATMEVAPCVKMMVQLFAGSCDDFVRHHGHEGAKRYLNATRKGLVIQKVIASKVWNTTEEYERNLKELGSYYVGSSERETMELKREFELLSKLMEDDDCLEWCDSERLSSVDGMSPDFCCGIYFPKDAVIDSSLYAKTVLKHLVTMGRGAVEFSPSTTVRSIDSHLNMESVAIQTSEDPPRRITAKHVVVATGALQLLDRQHERLHGLIKPCYSYLVHVPTTDTDDLHATSSPNFFTWGYTHDWCYTNGKVRISGEDHFSAYKPPRVEDRCNRLSRWTLERYGCSDLYTDKEISSFPKQYGVYSETVDMAPMIGTCSKEPNICYLLGCNAWGQTILSYCASLVPGLLGYQELTEEQKDVLKLVSIRRFSRLPENN